jgi:hypothetical protein
MNTTRIILHAIRRRVGGLAFCGGKVMQKPGLVAPRCGDQVRDTGVVRSRVNGDE